MSAKSKLEGRRFGRLTVLRDSGQRKGNMVSWTCLCACGNFTEVSTGKLQSNHTRSCGCLHDERASQHMRNINAMGKNRSGYKHGREPARLYSIWSTMKSRCHNPNRHGDKWYRGKGITVCPEWEKDFVPFRDWALVNNYRDDLTIDRIDSSGNYCPENCQWIPRAENIRKSVREREERKRLCFQLIGKRIDDLYKELNATK